MLLVLSVYIVLTVLLEMVSVRRLVGASIQHLYAILVAA